MKKEIDKAAQKKPKNKKDLAKEFSLKIENLITEYGNKGLSAFEIVALLVSSIYLIFSNIDKKSLSSLHASAMSKYL